MQCPCGLPFREGHKVEGKEEQWDFPDVVCSDRGKWKANVFRAIELQGGAHCKTVEQTKSLEPCLTSPQQKEAWHIFTLAVLGYDPLSTSSRRVWLHTSTLVSHFWACSPPPPHCNAEMGKFDEGSTETVGLFLYLISSAHWAEHPYVTPLGTTRSY